MWGRGVRGNREVFLFFLLRGGSGGRIASIFEVISKEGGSWGKHGFFYESEPKVSDAHGTCFCTIRPRILFINRVVLSVAYRFARLTVSSIATSFGIFFLFSLYS